MPCRTYIYGALTLPGYPVQNLTTNKQLNHEKKNKKIVSDLQINGKYKVALLQNLEFNSHKGIFGLSDIFSS